MSKKINSPIIPGRKRRYALIGASHRAMAFFATQIIKTYHSSAELCAILDLDPRRATAVNESLDSKVLEYGATDFNRMVDETKPDCVIVSSVDATHAGYIIAALERDLDVYSEKPLATDEHQCRAILAAEKKSKGTVTVTFNYRYAPTATLIKELMLAGSTGPVVSLDLNWYLDTYHGSSYFMRWNRLRANSGGLNVHKASHHFDLMSWFIEQKPVEVFAYGKRNFYGVDGPLNPSRKDGRTCPTCAERATCAYYMRWHRDEWRGAASAVELDEHVSGLAELNHYKSAASRRCIYDSEIDIEDTYTAVIKYDGGATATYSLNASVPYEGYRLGVNGMEGRLETTQIQTGVRDPRANPGVQPIRVYPMWGGESLHHPPVSGGGHGGADPLLADDLFLGVSDKPVLRRRAPLMDGVLAVLTGVAFLKSIREHRPVTIKELLGDNP